MRCPAAVSEAVVAVCGSFFVIFFGNCHQGFFGLIASGSQQKQGTFITDAGSRQVAGKKIT